MKDKLQPENPVIRFLTRVCDLLMLNFMVDFLCLTIVLMGSVVTSLYSVTLKMVYRESDSVVRPFLRGIRSNVVSSFPATILLFADVFLIALCHEGLHAEALLFSPFLLVGLAAMAVLLTALLSYLFPLIARFENSFSKHLNHAVRLALANLPTTCLLTLVNLLPYLSVAYMPQGGYLLGFWLLMGVAGGAYVNSFYLRRVFDQIS